MACKLRRISITGESLHLSRTWEGLEQLVDVETLKPIEILVSYEQRRTGLNDTLDTGWSYPPRRPGSTHTASDGWKVYYTQSRDTLKSIAKRLGTTEKQLFDQNVMAYAVGDTRPGPPHGKNKLDPKRKFPANEQFRVPR